MAYKQEYTEVNPLGLTKERKKNLEIWNTIISNKINSIIFNHKLGDRCKEYQNTAQKGKGLEIGEVPWLEG